MYHQAQKNLPEAQIRFSDSAPSARICSEYLTNDLWLHLFKFLFLDGVPCSSPASVTLPFLVRSWLWAPVSPTAPGLSFSANVTATQHRRLSPALPSLKHKDQFPPCSHPGIQPVFSECLSRVTV